MSDSEKPSRNRAATKPPLVIHPVSIAGEFRAKETRAEMESRLKIMEADALHHREQDALKLDHEQKRDRLILRVGLTAIGLIGIYCLVLNALPGSHVEGRAWATSTLTGIVGGLVGYIVGTAKKS
ncbi:hypothetical protein P12x_002354 [Tundrisphaera lichenicola]|uniref:hypothetical protein n=1 Tax=Tundrisphaera lichenicola TaxID=2029860 RepID=UPI003EBF25AE